MAALSTVTAAMLVVILIALLAVITLKALKGDINTAGLLRTDQNGVVDPERVLMLVGTVFCGFAYFSYGLSVGCRTGSLPDMPEQLVTAMSGGNFLYLSGKIFRTGKR